IDGKLSRRGPDGDANRSTIEPQPLPPGARAEQAHTRLRLDVNFTNPICRNGCARLTIGFQCLTNSQASFAVHADGLRTQLWRAREAGHVPSRARGGDLL